MTNKKEETDVRKKIKRERERERGERDEEAFVASLIFRLTHLSLSLPLCKLSPRNELIIARPRAR